MLGGSWRETEKIIEKIRKEEEMERDGRERKRERGVRENNRGDTKTCSENIRETAMYL